MRNPERIDHILNLIREIWIQQPDTRFLQLIENLTREFSRQNNNKLHETVYKKEELDHVIVFGKEVIVDGFNVEDDEFEKFLRDYYKLISDDGEIVYRASGKLKKKYGI